MRLIQGLLRTSPENSILLPGLLRNLPSSDAPHDLTRLISNPVKGRRCVGHGGLIELLPMQRQCVPWLTSELTRILKADREGIEQNEASEQKGNCLVRVREKPPETPANSESPLRAPTLLCRRSESTTDAEKHFLSKAPFGEYCNADMKARLGISCTSRSTGKLDIHVVAEYIE